MTGFAADSAGAMAAPGSHSTAPVTIRDRRPLPFFQVRLHAVHAIRSETNGPRRLRAIGFYALLCQLANEQRHTGEHRIVRVTYDSLSERGQTSKRSVKLLLDALERAGVIRYERQTDPATGGVMSLLHPRLVLDSHGRDGRPSRRPARRRTPAARLGPDRRIPRVLC
jgi:hypothetical protein